MIQLRCYYDDLADYLKYGHKENEEIERIAKALLMFLKNKDEYSFYHSIRVGQYAMMISYQLNLDLQAVYQSYISGLLHDIGKIYVPDSILLKNEPLTGEEYTVIKDHPIASESICKPIPALKSFLPVIRAHHERFDGNGYPDNLAGKDIPLLARIVSVADALDAMTSDRPYQKCMPLKKAKFILRNGAGTQWDDSIVDIALNIFLNRETDSMIPIIPDSYNYWL